MTNLNKKYQEFYDEIQISEERKEKIYENIMESKKQKKVYLKPIFITVVLIVFIALGSLGLVYAEEIKNAFNTIRIFHSNKDNSRVTTIKSNAIAEINYEADIPEADVVVEEERIKGIKNKEYTIQELEELLGIKLLKSEYYKKEKLEQYYTEKVDNKISRASFLLENFTNAKYFKKGKLEDKEDVYTMSISFVTKYCPAHEQEIDMEITGEYREDVYYIDALDTTVYIMKLGLEDNVWGTGNWIVRFDYHNIHYKIEAHMYNKNEEEKTNALATILNSLHL